MKEQRDKQLNEESKIAQEYRDHKPDIDWMYAKFNQIADEMRELKKWYYEEVAKDKNRNKTRTCQLDINMASTTPVDDEIRRILNDEDIERLRKRFLCALKDMDNNNTNNSYDFDQVYDRIGLGGYDLPLAMGRVIEDYLLSQGLN